MSNPTLQQLLAQNQTAPAPTKGGKGAKPIGSINLKLMGVNVFTRSVWEESTSETAFLNELNDLANTKPEELKKIVTLLLSKVEVEVNTRQHSDATLADLLK